MKEIKYEILRRNKMNDLRRKENWTPELIYIHKTRLVMGFIFGLVIGWLSFAIIF